MLKSHKLDWLWEIMLNTNWSRWIKQKPKVCLFHMLRNKCCGNKPISQYYRKRHKNQKQGKNKYLSKVVVSNSFVSVISDCDHISESTTTKLSKHLILTVNHTLCNMVPWNFMWLSIPLEHCNWCDNTCCYYRWNSGIPINIHAYANTFCMEKRVTDVWTNRMKLNHTLQILASLFRFSLKTLNKSHW